MKIPFLSLVFFVSGTFCVAQTTGKEKHNALSFELGKTGLIYNINFDHKFLAGSFGFRLGAGSNLAKYLKAINLGGGGYYLIGERQKYLELGLDVYYLNVDEVSDDQQGLSSILVYPNYSIETIYSSVNLGYRRYGKNSLFRIGISPGIISDELIPGGYVSYGYIF